MDEALILASRPGMVRRATWLVGSQDAEDVVHDAFERALRARSFRTGDDPRPWLSRIVRNVAYDALRRQTRTGSALDPDLAIGGESAERSAVRHETATAIGRALELLAPKYRDTLRLHDLEGYSNAEIASLEDVPYHTVRTRLARARRAMRELLQAEAA